MAVFNFPFHRVTTEYPDNSARVRFGRGYQFASRPVGPDQLTFRLSFETMCYFELAAGGYSSTHNPTLNMLALQKFYETHGLFEKFTYTHDLHGTVQCRFDKPLVTPKGIKGQTVILPNGIRQHACESFELQLISQP
jgi:hypothetical protein